MGIQRTLAMSLLGLVLLAAAGSAGAQAPTQPPTLEELCASSLCRKPTVRLRVDGDQTFERSIDTALPVLQGQLLAIYPGETAYVEVEVDDRRVVFARAVETVRDPARTLTFKFEQMAGQKAMMLVTNNPLAVGVRFRMGFFPIDSDRPRKTSSCPVGAGMSTYEHWPHPIFEILVTDPTIVGPNDDRSCR